MARRRRGTLLPRGRDAKGREVWGLRAYVDGRQRWLGTVCGTKRMAEEQLTRLLAALDSGEMAAPDKMTVSDLLMEYIATQKDTLKPRSWENNRRWAEKELIPLIGHMKAQDVDPSDCEALKARLLRAPRRDGQKGTKAPRTVAGIITFLRSAFEHARRRGVINRNPMAGISRPRSKTPVEYTIYSAEQLGALLADVKGTMWHVPLAIAVYTGMRRSEILGLQWRDVDFEAGFIRVERQVLDSGETSTLKSTSARRRIQIYGDLRSVLVEAAMRRQGKRPSDFVCIWPDGTLIRPTFFSQRWQEIRERAGLPPARLHDLRHTFATMLLARGVPVKIVSEMLGHADPLITIRVYQSVVPDMQDAAMAALGDIFGSKLSSRVAERVDARQVL